jgi:hypothetical protein
MARTRYPSRASRWQTAVDDARTALDAMEAAKADFDGAMEALRDVQSEYQDWYDNLPDAFQQDSPVGEKLQAVTDLDLDPGDDLEAMRSAVDEAEGADLPLGWGRD